MKKKELARIFVWIYYSLNWLFIFINAFYIYKILNLLQYPNYNEREKLIIDKYASKLKTYPIVLLICYIPATINRIYTLITGDENFYLYFLHQFFGSLQGFFFAISFGLNSQIQMVIVKIFRKLCGNKQKPKSGKDLNNKLCQDDKEISDYSLQNNSNSQIPSTRI